MPLRLQSMARIMYNYLNNNLSRLPVRRDFGSTGDFCLRTQHDLSLNLFPEGAVSDLQSNQLLISARNSLAVQYRPGIESWEQMSQGPVKGAAAAVSRRSANMPSASAMSDFFVSRICLDRNFEIMSC